MIRIMVVDDESIFRDYLRRAIDWETYGFTICCEAKNGLEALEQAEEHQPQIALIDINMPQMDGLLLTEKLKELYPLMSIVLITGHSEFEYARKAVRLGVEDYILKPFAKEELVLTMLKSRRRIEQVQEHNTTLRQNLEMLREAFLNRLLQPDYDGNDLQTMEKLETFGLSFRLDSVIVACVEIDRMEQMWTQIGEKRLWKFAVSNILGEVLGSDNAVIMFNGPEGRIVCLMEARAGSTLRAEGFERLRVLVKKYLKFTITIGIGRVHAGVAGIAHSYAEALTALRYKFVLGHDRVLAYDELPADRTPEGVFAVGTNEELLMQLRMNEIEKVKAKLGEVFQAVRERRLSIDYTYVVCMGLVSLCLSFVSESGHPIEDCFGDGFYPYNDIQRMDSIEAAEAWITGLYERAAAYANEHKHTRSRKIAVAARQFIEAHYSNPELNVEQVAQHVYINPSYLRAVFKKEIGMTVADYVTHVRMQKAKELIAVGHLKLSDVAEAIGYSDASYFSKSFKKFYGRSPSEYENIVKP